MSASFDQLPVLALAVAEVVHADRSANVYEVADLLHDNDIGAVVLGGEHVDGIVTERDVVAALAQRRDLSTTTAADIASRQLIWCEGDTTIAEAAQQMAERWVRHLLIRDGERLAGIVSARDLLGGLIDIGAITDLADDLDT